MYFNKTKTLLVQYTHSSNATHLDLLHDLDAVTFLDAGEDGAVGDHQDAKGDQEADQEAGVVEARHHGAVLARLKATLLLLGVRRPLVHVEHLEVKVQNRLFCTFPRYR